MKLGIEATQKYGLQNNSLAVKELFCKELQQGNLMNHLLDTHNMVTAMEFLNSNPNYSSARTTKETTCYCCANDHKHPQSGETLACDRRLVFETLKNLGWNPNRGIPIIRTIILRVYIGVNYQIALF